MTSHASHENINSSSDLNSTFSPWLHCFTALDLNFAVLDLSFSALDLSDVLVILTLLIYLPWLYCFIDPYLLTCFGDLDLTISLYLTLFTDRDLFHWLKFLTLVHHRSCSNLAITGGNNLEEGCGLCQHEKWGAHEGYQQETAANAGGNAD